MSELCSRTESRSARPSRGEGDPLMEASVVRALGRTVTGRALSLALLGFGAHSTTPAAHRMDLRLADKRATLTKHAHRRQEASHAQGEGPDIESVAAAWELSPGFYREWLRTSFPAELSDPHILGAIRMTSNEEGIHLHDHSIGSPLSLVTHTDSGSCVISLFPRAFDAIDAMYATSPDRCFDEIMHTKYRVFARLMVESVSHSAKEAAATCLQEARARAPHGSFFASSERNQAHVRPESLGVEEWFAIIGAEACQQSSAETEMVYKAAVVDRVLTRARLGAESRPHVTKSVDLFFECIQAAYPDFSFYRTAKNRQAGVEEMRRGYRTAAVKRVVDVLDVCDGIEGVATASFDRVPQEWSLVERLSLLPESEIPSTDLALVRQVVPVVTEQARVTREASEAIRRQAHAHVATTKSGIYAALLDGMTHHHESKGVFHETKTIEQALAVWDHLRAELRALRRGLKRFDAAQQMTHDDFTLHAHALAIAVDAFVRLWQRLSVQDRERVRPILGALDRLYEGDDRVLTVDQRACAERILANSSL